MQLIDEVFERFSEDFYILCYLEKITAGFKTKGAISLCMAIAIAANRQHTMRRSQHHRLGTSFSLLRDYICRFFYPHLPVTAALMMWRFNPTCVKLSLGLEDWHPFLRAVALYVKQTGQEEYEPLYDFLATWRWD